MATSFDRAMAEDTKVSGFGAPSGVSQSFGTFQAEMWECWKKEHPANRHRFLNNFLQAQTCPGHCGEQPCACPVLALCFMLFKVWPRLTIGCMAMACLLGQTAACTSGGSETEAMSRLVQQALLHREYLISLRHQHHNHRLKNNIVLLKSTVSYL